MMFYVSKQYNSHAIREFRVILLDFEGESAMERRRDCVWESGGEGRRESGYSFGTTHSRLAWQMSMTFMEAVP